MSGTSSTAGRTDWKGRPVQGGHPFSPALGCLSAATLELSVKHKIKENNSHLHHEAEHNGPSTLAFGTIFIWQNHTVLCG